MGRIDHVPSFPSVLPVEGNHPTTGPDYAELLPRSPTHLREQTGLAELYAA